MMGFNDIQNIQTRNIFLNVRHASDIAKKEILEGRIFIYNTNTASHQPSGWSLACLSHTYKFDI